MSANVQSGLEQFENVYDLLFDIYSYKNNL